MPNLPPEPRTPTRGTPPAPPNIRGLLPRLDRPPGRLGPGPVRPAHRRELLPAGPRAGAGRVHRRRVGPAQRPARADAGHRTLPGRGGRAADRQARPADAQRGLHLRPARLGRRVRVRRHARGQHADDRGDGHHGPARKGGDLGPHEKGPGREEEAGLGAGHPGQPDAGGHCGGKGRSTAQRPRRREQPPGGGARNFHAGVGPRLDGHRRRAQRLRFPHQEGRGVPARAGQARGGALRVNGGFSWAYPQAPRLLLATFTCRAISGQNNQENPIADIQYSGFEPLFGYFVLDSHRWGSRWGGVNGEAGREKLCERHLPLSDPNGALLPQHPF